MNSQWGISFARSANQKYKFLQASTIYGLKDDKTLYGGAIISEKHQGISAGIGSSLGHFGSVSADVTHTKSRLATGQDRKGQQYRIQYAKILKQRVPTLRWPAINTRRLAT